MNQQSISIDPILELVVNAAVQDFQGEPEEYKQIPSVYDEDIVRMCFESENPIKPYLERVLKLGHSQGLEIRAVAGDFFWYFVIFNPCEENQRLYEKACKINNTQDWIRDLDVS